MTFAKPFEQTIAEMSGTKVAMTPQEEADSLPTHPVFGRWMLCSCGAHNCRRVYPFNLGTFYQGSGFEPEEVREIMQYMHQPTGVLPPESRNETETSLPKGSEV